jgi:cytochrome c oxidase cbb3-type subunit 3
MFRAIGKSALLALGLTALPVALPAWAGTVDDNYRLHCVQCHGSKGNGEGINNTYGGLSVGPRNHTDAAEMSKLTDDEIRRAILEGGDAVNKSELMPRWNKTLTANEIDELVAYLRSLCKCKGPN